MVIKLCRKCGAAPIEVRTDDANRGPSISYMCINPDCGKMSEEKIKEAAIIKWNRDQS